MDRYELSDTQNAILLALLEKRARLNSEIDKQLQEFLEMLCAREGVDHSWRLMGNPQQGFALVPPETGADASEED